jgi:hypothetical protein
MMGQATKSRPREDLDHEELDHATDAPELATETVMPPIAEPMEDDQRYAGIPPLQTAAPKRRSGIVSLIIIAILGMALGFAAVMLI